MVQGVRALPLQYREVFTNVIALRYYGWLASLSLRRPVILLHSEWRQAFYQSISHSLFSRVSADQNKMTSQLPESVSHCSNHSGKQYILYTRAILIMFG